MRNQLSPVVIRGAEKFGELGAMVIGLSKGKVPPEGILKAVKSFALKEGLVITTEETPNGWRLTTEVGSIEMNGGDLHVAFGRAPSASQPDYRR